MADREEDGQQGGGRVPWGALLAIVAAAAAVRAVVWDLTMVIGADGPAFIELAALFGKGDFAGAMAHPSSYHPLYPMLLGGVSHLLGEPEVVGRSISLLFGCLTPIPLFLLARRFAGDRAALIAGLLLAAHPVAARLSVDVKSDSLYAFLFVSAAFLSWRGIGSLRLGPLFLAGIVGGLAYLARPEGLGVVFVATAWLLFVRRVRWGRRLALAGILLLGAAVPAAPYAAAISQDGTFRITRKKSLSDFLGVAPESSRGGEPEVRRASILPLPQWTPARELREGGEGLGLPRRAGLAAAEVIGEFTETLHPALLLFLVAGVVLAGATPRARSQELFLGGLVAVYLALLFLLVLGVGYLSRRHVYPLNILALPWVAVGVDELARRLSPGLARRKVTALLTPWKRTAALLLGGTVLLLAPKTFYPHRLDQLMQREAGLWIRAVSGGSPAPVLTHMEKVAYYAGARWIPIRKDYRSSMDIGRHFRARYVAIYREKVDRAAPGFFEAIRVEELVREVSFRHSQPGAWLRDREEIHLDVFRIVYE